MCAYMYAGTCMCICTCMCAYAWLRVYVRVCMHVSVYVYVCMCIYACKFTYICVFMYAHVCVCVYVFIYSWVSWSTVQRHEPLTEVREHLEVFTSLTSWQERRVFRAGAAGYVQNSWRVRYVWQAGWRRPRCAITRTHRWF